MLSYSPLHARLENDLKKRKLIEPKERLLIGLSGGQDSLCLSKILLDLSKRWSWDLAIVHCDHGWATDTGIAEHVRGIVQGWNIPFYLKTIQGLPEKEEEARKWRYQVFTEIATNQGYNCVLTGHTQSDRAETLLYNLIRGTGSDGLSALNWSRALTFGVKLIRPMLNITRKETGQFCLDYDLPIWEDAVNQKLEFARNRIRLEMIPYLAKHFNTQVEQHLGQTAEILRAENQYFQVLVDDILAKVSGPDKINRKALQDLALALQRRVIRSFLGHYIHKMPNFEQIEETLFLLKAPNGSKTSTLPGQVLLVVEGDWIVVKSLNKSIDP